MSRYHPLRDIEPILQAAVHWKQVALLGTGAVFTESALWTDANLDSLKKHFVDNLDYGEGNFLEKLESQLAPADPAVNKLMAEMTWVMLLCPSNIGPENKRDNVSRIWAWSGEPLPSSPLLEDELLTGIGGGGTAFNTQRWREVVFFINFMRAFRALELTERQELLKDGWQFAEWIQSIEEADARQFRHMLIYLLFPDTFERLFGRSERIKLLESFTGMPKSQIRTMTALEVSRAIQKVRAEQEVKLKRQDIDFYHSPLLEMWSEARKKKSKPSDNASDFLEKTADVTRDHILEAIAEIDREAYPPDAKSSTYDLIHGGNRYPPKYVLSLATKYTTGVAMARNHFTGGEDSQAFKLLRDRGFTIERKDLLQEMISKFLAQADESVSLVVKDYPKKYRGLDVKVSFGQGNYAKVPWISYTAYGQSTSDGIYPVILYYKSVSTLIVTHGVSETNKPKADWKNVDELRSVSEYFESKHHRQAERYGSSFVYRAFELSEGVDTAAIQQALDEVIGVYHEQFEHIEAIPSSTPAQLEPYTVEDAIKDLFIDEDKFIEIVELLREKKNLILQGAPGVGKTYASKRLAFALMGEQDQDRLGMVQFHQSYSYEDFIQGYRPSGAGFRLKNGIFYEFCDRARNEPDKNFVFIIDELNRGNLSKIFGELMLLIETDKRGPDWAIPLAYAEEDSPKFYVPENLYLIGLMNTADRSLAMVDYALRRRFAFSSLEPGFESEQFFDYLVDAGATKEIIDQIVNGMSELNDAIASDTANLGPGFRIGHSFFCSISSGIEPNRDWYERVIKAEIAPLLYEYYFDSSDKADELVQKLLR